MSRFLSEKLMNVTPYTPGEQPQDQQYIKLNTNESPYPPSPAVLEAVSRAEVEKLRLYSDPACAELLNAAAKHFGLQPSNNILFTIFNKCFSYWCSICYNVLNYFTNWYSRRSIFFRFNQQNIRNEH